MVTVAYPYYSWDTDQLLLLQKRYRFGFGNWKEALCYAARLMQSAFCKTTFNRLLWWNWETKCVTKSLLYKLELAKRRTNTSLERFPQVWHERKCMQLWTYTVMKLLQGLQKYFLSNYYYHFLHHFFTSYYAFLSGGKIETVVQHTPTNHNKYLPYNITFQADSTFSSS